MNILAQKFNVLAIDFPWSYNSPKTGGSMNSGSAQKYMTMSWSEITNFPIDDLMEKDAIVFLWVTTPLKPEITKVVDAWKLMHCLKYKTTIYWKKIRIGRRRGLGAWLSGDVEECWMLVRGNVKATKLIDSNHITSRVGEHSEKPDEVYDLMTRIGNKAFATPKYIDIFARKQREGWAVMGNAIDGKDVIESIAVLTKTSTRPS